MINQSTLLALSVTAWFAVFATLFSLPRTRSLSWLHLKHTLNRQVMLAMDRSPRSRALGQKLRKMLAAATFQPGGKPLSVAFFLAVSLFLGLALAVSAAIVLRNPLVMLLFFGVGAGLPYQVLEIGYNRQRGKLRRQAASFLLTVGNLYGVYGDPVVALEEAIPRLKDPLRPQISWFVTAYKGGLPLTTCVETMKSRLPDVILRHFWDDVLFYTERGGDFQECIMEHVHQVYQREINAAKGGADVGSTITVFFVLIGVYIAVLVTLTHNQPELMSFLVSDPRGKAAVTLMAVIFVIAGYFVKLMTTQREDD
jgi:Flp pilus assembly protein TadB